MQYDTFGLLVGVGVMFSRDLKDEYGNMSKVVISLGPFVFRYSNMWVEKREGKVLAPEWRRNQLYIHQVGGGSSYK